MVLLPARATVVPVHYVIGIIVPWIIRCSLSVSPLVQRWPPLPRDGKDVEFTPAFSALFQRLIGSAFRSSEVAASSGVLNVAAQFSALPFEPSFIYRLDISGPQGDGCGIAEPDTGDAGAGGKSRLSSRRLPDRKCRAARPRRQAVECRPTCIAPDYALVSARAGGGVYSMHPCGSAVHVSGWLDDPDYCSIVNSRRTSA